MNDYFSIKNSTGKPRHDCQLLVIGFELVYIIDHLGFEHVGPYTLKKIVDRLTEVHADKDGVKMDMFILYVN